MNMDYTKHHSIHGVFVDTKAEEVLAGRYLNVKKEEARKGITGKLVGAAAGAAVAGPIGAIVGFMLVGNKKK